MEAIYYFSGFLATVLASNYFMRITIFNKLLLGRVCVSLFNIFDIGLVTQFYSKIGIPYYYFLFSSSVLSSGTDMFFTRLPLMIIFANITPLHIEASFFALMASVFNIGMALSEVFASVVMSIIGINNAYSENL